MNLEMTRPYAATQDDIELAESNDFDGLVPIPNRPIQSAAIRVFDLIVSALALAVLLPIFILIAIGIKLDSQGPVLFVQERVGRYGTHFKLYKFRSMIVNAEAQRQVLEAQNERGGVVFKIRNDPRVTRIGYWLRKCSVDELPQLINIFMGQMSLVGPRPALPIEVNQYTPRDRQRLLITPGLTGLWQVSGRASVSFDKMVDLDLQYIQERSFWLNFKILLLTVPAVVSAKGAY